MWYTSAIQSKQIQCKMRVQLGKIPYAKQNGEREIFRDQITSKTWPRSTSSRPNPRSARPQLRPLQAYASSVTRSSVSEWVIGMSSRTRRIGGWIAVCQDWIERTRSSSGATRMETRGLAVESRKSGLLVKLGTGSNSPCSIRTRSA